MISSLEAEANRLIFGLPAHQRTGILTPRRYRELRTREVAMDDTQHATRETPALRTEGIGRAYDQAGLSPQERAVISLAAQSDLTQAEIADQLGMGERTVRRILSAAREKLRGVLRS